MTERRTNCAERPEATRPEDSDSSALHTLKALTVLGGMILGATAAVNGYTEARTPLLDSRLGGEFKRYPARYGDMAYTVTGSGPPLLLLPALRLGNSMDEWWRNFSVLGAGHTVYAFDYLGWGLSDKPEPGYSAGDYIEQILYFAQDIIGAPCALLASGQSAGYAVVAAYQQPELFSRLILTCPSTDNDGQTGAKIIVRHELLWKLFRTRIIGTALYNYLASRDRLEAVARRELFFDKSLADPNQVSRYHLAAHQRGSRYAAAAWLCGKSDVEWRESWSELAQPALLVWGRNVLSNGLDRAPEWLALKPDAGLEVIDRAMLLPHQERPEQFNAVVRQWLND